MSDSPTLFVLGASMMMLRPAHHHHDGLVAFVGSRWHASDPVICHPPLKTYRKHNDEVHCYSSTAYRRSAASLSSWSIIYMLCSSVHTQWGDMSK